MRGLPGTPRAAAAFLLCGLVAAWGTGCRSIQNPPPPQDGGFVAMPLDDAAVRRAGAHAWYATAAGAEREADFAAACDAYRRALALDPGSSRAAIGAASMLVRLHREREALELAEDFLAGHPDSDRVLGWLGQYYATNDEPGRARELLERLVALDPATESNWMLLSAAAAAEHGDSPTDDAAVAAVQAVLDRGIAAAPPALDLHRLAARIQLARLDALGAGREEDARRSLDAAIAHLRIATEAEPGDGAPWIGLGSLYLRAGNPAEALTCFEEALKLRPDDSALRERILLTRFRIAGVGGGDAAEAPLPEAPDAATCVRQGRLYLKNRLPDEAEAQFRRATELDPGYPDGWLCLAALQYRDDPAEAAETLRLAAAHLPDDPGIIEMLAGFTLALDRPSEAIALFERAAELHERAAGDDGGDDDVAPLSASFCNNYALALTRVRRLDEAAGWLVRGMEAEPDLHLRYIALALDRYSSRTQRRNVLSVLRRADKLTGHENAALSIAQAALLMDAADAPGAVRAFRRAFDTMEKHPFEKARNQTPRTLYWYGVALEGAGERDASLDVLRRCLELDPDFAEALNHLAYVWAEAGENLDEALDYSLRSLAGDPDNAAYLDTLGWIHYQMGNIPEAVRHLHRAARLRPGDETITDHLREALSRAEALGLELPEGTPAATPAPDSAGPLSGEEDGDGEEGGDLFGFPDAEEELLDDL